MKYWFWNPQAGRVHFIFKEGDDGIMTLYGTAYVGRGHRGQKVYSIDERDYLQDWVNETQVRAQGHSIPIAELQLYAFEQGFVLREGTSPYAEWA